MILSEATDIAERTFKGFLWFCWGMAWYWPFHLGAYWFLIRRGRRYRVGRWIVQQFGWARNPEWPSKNEMNWYREPEKREV